MSSEENKKKIKNLLDGLKQIQQKNLNISQRSGSDMSFEKQMGGQEKLACNFKSNLVSLQKKKKSGNSNYATINTEDLKTGSKIPGEFEAIGNFATVKDRSSKKDPAKNKI